MNGKVLIVDDEPSMCEMIAKHLKVRDFEYETCSVPTEAIEKIRTENFDVILSDVNMPGMTGIELCQQSLEARPDIPFVIMTAFGSLETAVEAIRAGAFDFVNQANRNGSAFHFSRTCDQASSTARDDPTPQRESRFRGRVWRNRR